MGSSRGVKHATQSIPFIDRASLPGTSPLGVFLFSLMARKKSNLCLSADVQTSSELLELAEECGDSICILKTHADIVYDFNRSTIEALTEIAARKHFVIFEDRKFGDIGNTVQMQYTGGTHRIASWAPMVNAHIFPGPAIIQALRSAAYEAMSSSNMIVTREIIGGRAARLNGDQLARMRRRSLDEESLSPGTRGGDDDENDQENVAAGDDETDSDDDYSGCISPGPHETVYGRSLTMDEIRRGSSIAIHTTISSTTEKVTRDMMGDASQFRGLLLLAQMSSEDNLFTSEYTHRCVELARQYSNFVMGFIAQEGLNEQPGDNFITMTPGVSHPPATTTQQATPQHQRRQSHILSSHRRASMQVNTQMSDSMGQRYNTPRDVISEKGVDVIIVGRGILQAEDAGAECERYRREGWAALCDRWGVRA